MKQILDNLVRLIRIEILSGNFTLENVGTSWLDSYDLHAWLVMDGLTLEFHASEHGLVYQGSTRAAKHHIEVLEYLEDSDVADAIYNAFKPHLRGVTESRIAYLEEELNKLKQI